MLSNAIRGHMAELGIISAKGRNGTAELAKDDRLAPVARFCLEMLARQYAALAAEIGAVNSTPIGEGHDDVMQIRSFRGSGEPVHRTLKCVLTIGTRSPQSIRASGHSCRTNRPDS